MSRTRAIRLAAQVIENLTGTDEGALPAAREAVDRLAYELGVVAVAEAQPKGPEHISKVLERALRSVPGPVAGDPIRKAKVEAE